jgi:hypothetical protein
MSQAEAKPMTGAERAKRFRERRFINATPTGVQFDRELRAVFFQSLDNETMAPLVVKILAVTRERLRKKFSKDGIDSVIAKYGERQ